MWFFPRSVLGFAARDTAEEMRVPRLGAGYPVAPVGCGSATLTAFPTSREATGRGCREGSGGQDCTPECLLEYRCRKILFSRIYRVKSSCL